MSNEINAGNAEPVETPTAEQSNISAAEFAARRLGQFQSKQALHEKQPHVEESTEEVEEPSSESNEEVVNENELSEQHEESQDSPDVLSQLDLDEMSEEDLRELSEKLGSRAVARFGELTAKRKAAEEQLQMLQAKLENNNPLETQEVADNPYSELKTIESLQDKAKEINDVIEWAEETLFEADQFGPDDIITTVDGKDLTKKDVRKSLLNSRKARDKYLPAQYRSVQRIEQGKQLEDAFVQQAQQEISWLQGEDNDTRKQYEAMINDKRFISLKENADPEIKAQLDYLMAHAANSIYGRKVIKDKPNSPNLTPPSTGASGSSRSEKTVKGTTKAIKDLDARFRQSNSKNDFIALRTAIHKNR